MSTVKNVGPFVYFLRPPVAVGTDLLNIKTPNPKYRLYWCLIEFKNFVSERHLALLSISLILLYGFRLFLCESELPYAIA